MVDGRKGRVARLVGAGLLVTGAGPASAEVFQTADTIAARTVMLGIEPQVTPPEGPAYELFLHGGVGMTSATDLQMKLGVPVHPGGAMYLGGEVQITLLEDQDGAPGISLGIGGHGRGWERFGLDTTLILSNDFGRLDPFFAVDADLEFIGNSVDPILHLAPGLRVDISKVSRFFCELGVGVSAAAPIYVSAGFQFTI